MKFVTCTICQQSKLQGIKLQYSNPELGTKKLAIVCKSCEKKKLNEILHKVVHNA